MACLTRLDYDESAKQYVGKDYRTGETKTFQTLDGYKSYVNALNMVGISCEQAPLPKATVAKKMPEDTTYVPSGFMEFSARDPDSQAKYSAMSSKWEGVEASEGAISRGLYALDTVIPPKKDGREFVPRK